MGGIAGLVSWGPPLEPNALQPIITAGGQRSRDGIHNPTSDPYTSFAHLKIADVDWVTTTGVITTPNLTIVTDSRLDDRKNLTNTLGLPHNTPDPNILHAAWNKWGPNLAQHLTGDYAFAIYNHTSKTLTAARDPFSMRSLHWTRTPNGIAIASDATQLLAHPNVTEQPNLNTLAAYILGLTPKPNETFWQNIETIPPGQTTTITQNTHTQTRHWHLDPEHTIRYKNTSDYTDHCQHLLTTAINDRLANTTHTTGLSLSGGVDSTTVATLAAKQNHTLNTYSFSFTQPHLKDSDETHISTPLAQHLNHPNTLIPADNLGPLSGSYVESVDRPAASPFAEANLAVVHRSASAADRVLITCDRGDSLFGGASLSAVRQMGVTKGRALRSLLATGDGVKLCGDIGRAIVRRSRRSPGSVQNESDPSWMASIPVESVFTADPGQRRIDWILDEVAQDIAAWSSSTWASHGVRFVDPFANTQLAEFAAAVPDSVLNTPGIPDKRLLLSVLRPIWPNGIHRPIKTSLAPLFFESTRQDPTPMLSGVRLTDPWPVFDAASLRVHADQFSEETEEPGRLLYAARAKRWHAKAQTLAGI